MLKLLSDEVAIVTGAASGNGRAIATEFARHGADVVIADIERSPREGGIPTHEQIETETNSSAAFVQCDVSSVADIHAAVEAAEELGELSIMVNNAGIISHESVLETTETEYHRVMDVNLKGTFFGSQIAAKQMAERESGSIINVSGTAGLVGSTNSPTYSASKGGVRLLTYSLAAHLGSKGIRVNAIHPGTVETEMMRTDLRIDGQEPTEETLNQIPLERTANPSDIAKCAVFLASDLASHVTAESLVVDGGMTNTS